MTTLDSLHASAALRIPDLPPLDQCGDYAAHLGKPTASTTWVEFCAEVDAERDHLASQALPALPIWPDETRTGWKAFHAPPPARDRLTELARNAKPSAATPGVLPVFRLLLERVAWWGRLPRSVDEKAEDFVFARLRCVLAGAGFENWGELATIACTAHPSCPFRPDETWAEWSDALLTAHRTCGWPSTLLWWDWNAIPDSEPDAADLEWLNLAALAHTIKHTRRGDRRIILAYLGLAESIDAPTNTRTLATAGQFKQVAGTVLRFADPKKSAKAQAMAWALNRIALDDLLPAHSIRLLPGSILAGIWSTHLPATTALAFLNPGRTLVNVWRAAEGRVTPYTGDEADVLDWEWNVLDASTPTRNAELGKFLGTLPRTYRAVRPTFLLRAVFPHWILPDAEPEREAYLAMLDAILCASILRSATPMLQQEFPLLAILARDPSVENSTNQGKGLMTAAIAGAIVPGIQMRTAPESNSAPDSRAVADAITQDGTIALDEFQVPTSRSHCLSRDNLQSLCTGGIVSSGRVMENSGSIRLSASIVVNAKWLDLADDLVNRTVPIFLDALPDAQRGRIDIKIMLESGQFAVLLRLAAIATVEQSKLDQIQPTPGAASASAWRFTHHRALAAALLGTDDALQRIDAVRAALSDDLRRHQQLADETGVSATTSSGRNLRLAWPTFWSGIDDTSLANMAATIQLDGEARRGVQAISIAHLIRLRLTQMGRSDGAPFCSILPPLTGFEHRVSNTAVTRALSLQMQSYFADYLNAGAKNDHYGWVPLSAEHPGWEVCVFPRCNGDSPSARTLSVAIRKKP